jgi:hypothetical protein
MQTIQKHHNESSQKIKNPRVPKEDDRTIMNRAESSHELEILRLAKEGDNGNMNDIANSSEELRNSTGSNEENCDEKIKNCREISQGLRNSTVTQSSDDGNVNSIEEDPTAVAKDGLEYESFFTVINRARKAAHTVSEQDIWGSD